MTPRLALKDGFEHWLEEITSGAKIRRGIDVYPFVTSMRSTAVMIPALIETSTGQPLSSNDPTQTVTDLRRAGLITGSHPGQSLTELGIAALDLWNQLGINNTDDADEIARCAALVRLGGKFGVLRYLDAFRFWCELVESAPVEYWLSDVYTLCLPTYLNQSDANGYNPYRVLIAANNGETGRENEWRSWAEDNAGNGLGANLAMLLDRVKASNRVGGCRAFCQGMEAYRLMHTDPEILPDTLRSWGLKEDGTGQ